MDADESFITAGRVRGVTLAKMSAERHTR